VNKRFCENADLRAAGLDELGRLGNIFTKDELRFHLFVEARVFERFDCGAAVGSVVGIGNGYFLNGGIQKRLPAGFFGIEFGFGGRPENEFADGVGIGGVGKDQAGFVEFAGVIAVGGEEEVEGSAVLDLGEEIAGRAEGEVEFYAGLFFVGGSELGHGEFEVGGRGDFELGLLSGREKRNCHRGTENAEKIKRHLSHMVPFAPQCKRMDAPTARGEKWRGIRAPRRVREASEKRRRAVAVQICAESHSGESDAEDHDFGGFDEGGSAFARLEAHFAGGVGGDERGDVLFSDAKGDLGEEAVVLDGNDAADKLIAAGDFAEFAAASSDVATFEFLGDETIYFGFGDAVMAAGSFGGFEFAAVNPLFEGGIADAENVCGFARSEESLHEIHLRCVW
jgi:hypothetical protein